MALNKSKLKSDIKALLNSQKRMTDQKSSIEALATGLSNIIDSYIKSATITANPTAITASTMSNTGGPVVAANNLISTLS